ncbi:MAG: purine-binding chemotaxis protein CheW [Gammaproteobacteria bacterium]|nr:purine-binding chemotaxis protein CheW [Gammaproteobacteria bacterium]MCB1849766.1 purine-binding chemotaxis protein CheW [Gammaproteobacteria bacterium]MCP5416497.1 purine-binding chemotaxis protein CheW [Chromatiaceae bacterium]
MANEKQQAVEAALIHEPLQLLTFLLDKEVYGIDISQIQEVLEYRKVTPVPRTPDYMLGVINLRGNVVSVVDLRRLFDMHVGHISVDTCIVIVDVEVDGEKTPMGILVDAVKQVITLSGGQISPPPRFGSRIDNRFISGMGKQNEEFIVILDLPRVFSQEEMEELIDTAQFAGAASLEEATEGDHEPGEHPG